ncbi:hypothetical protein JOB18_008867 [Solea senegalensis]|uniref:C2H2-type domain-containing protein n=1 Tax=Solea senegalensis TaxID=28829 RepID=A0AAV6RPU7_SOLSE|nr:hypothetical protein JOB18_008867 [Solea senegalensis]
MDIGVAATSNQEPDEEPQTAGPQQQQSSDCSPPNKQYERYKHRCPICRERYADIVQHLRSTEKVVNKTELSLLSKFSHRHFRANLDCPVRFCQSTHINRLDKHLQRIHSLKNPMVTLYIQKAKDRYIARELALLRASKPTPPMVSHLDEVDDAAIEEGVRRVIEAASHAAASSTVPPLSGPMSSSPLASQGSCDPKTKTMQDPSPSTSQASCDPEIPATQDPSPPTNQDSSDPEIPAMQDPSPSTSRASYDPGTAATLDPFPSTSHASCYTGTVDQQAKRRRRCSVLRAPDPGCRNCQLLFAELNVVKNLLQIEIERNDELKKLHSSTMRATAAKHRRRAPFPPSKAPRYVRLVEEFRGHTEGANPSRKTSENAKQRAKHVRDFLEYMADSSIPNVGLIFLSNHARIRSFVAVLQGKGFKPPTQRNYLMDAVAFMKYLSNMAPPSVRLGTKKINAILVELRARIRDIGRDVVRHQLSVRRSKSVKLEKHPEDRACLKEFFGLLGGYIIATTGHRKGVVINMTTKEVKAAEKTKQGAHIIRVGQHKTQRYFGEAAVPLKQSEYSWLRRYNLLRNKIEGGKEASTFFHTTSGGVLLKLSEYFKEAWQGMGLGTAPTFNMLRSSVATYAKRQLGHKTYQKVATFMCHDANTAKRFYQAEDPAEVTLQSRGLSMMAISTYAAKTRKRRENHKKGNTMTIASSEDEREDNEPAHNKHSQGFEEEEQEPLGQEKPVRERLNQLYSNKTLVPSDQQMVGLLTETVPDPEEDEEHVPKRAYQLREKRASVPLNQQMAVTSFKEDGTDKRESFSSSEGDGSADEWKPKQQESENDSEEDEEEVLQRVHKVAKGKRSECLVLQRKLNTAMVSLSPVTLNTPVMHQAFVSPGTTKALTIGSTSWFDDIMPISGSMGETVSKEWLLENEMGDTTLHKSLPEERPGDYEGQEKEGQVDEGYLEKTKIEGEDRTKTEDEIKGQKTQKERQEEALEKMDSDGEEGQKTDEKRHDETLQKMESKSEKRKKRPEERDILEKNDKVAVKVRPGMHQAFVSPGTANILSTHARKINMANRMIFHQSSLFEDIMPISGDNIEVSVGGTTLHDRNKTEDKLKEGQKTEKDTQEETLEKMDSDGKEGQKAEDKIHSDGGAGQKTKKTIQEETLENMEGKSERGKKRVTKIQEKTLENMEGKSERGKKRERNIQEKTLENMEGNSERGKKRERKIQEKTLENMEGKSERGKKREERFKRRLWRTWRVRVKEERREKERFKRRLWRTWRVRVKEERRE